MSSMLGLWEIKVKVIIVLEKLSHLVFQITSRWLFIADGGKSYCKAHQLYSYYKVRYVEGGKALHADHFVVWVQAFWYWTIFSF